MINQNFFREERLVFMAGEAVASNFNFESPKNINPPNNLNSNLDLDLDQSRGNLKKAEDNLEKSQQNPKGLPDKEGRILNQKTEKVTEVINPLNYKPQLLILDSSLKNISRRLNLNLGDEVTKSLDEIMKMSVDKSNQNLSLDFKLSKEIKLSSQKEGANAKLSLNIDTGKFKGVLSRDFAEESTKLDLGIGRANMKIDINKDNKVAVNITYDGVKGIFDENGMILGVKSGNLGFNGKFGKGERILNANLSQTFGNVNTNIDLTYDKKFTAMVQLEFKEAISLMAEINNKGLTAELKAKLGKLGDFMAKYTKADGLNAELNATLGKIANLIVQFNKENGISAEAKANVWKGVTVGGKFSKENGISPNAQIQLGEIATLMGEWNKKVGFGFNANVNLGNNTTVTGGFNKAEGVNLGVNVELGYNKNVLFSGSLKEGRFTGSVKFSFPI